ncbi:CRISPR-associated endonuclease Cas2 [Neisseria sp. S1]|uniref:CRISPR-associated endonuclease Cas2 n=1 Tax=Neisseria sp. S1 TaxID=3318354 RepID=UPI003A8B5CBB
MAKRHLYLFAYDISDARMRRRVREILRGYAVGGQKSLFECWLTAGELADLCRRLPNMIASGDKLQVVRLSESEPPVLFGIAKPLAFDVFMVV